MRTQPPSRGVSMPRQRKKKEWNLHLTDDDKYKLSQEEVLRRKKLFISKHNILTSSPNSLLSVKSNGRSGKARVVRTNKSKTKRQSQLGREDEGYDDEMSSNVDDITSLDLLTLDDVATHNQCINNTEILASKSNEVSPPSPRRLTKNQSKKTRATHMKHTRNHSSSHSSTKPHSPTKIPKVIPNEKIKSNLSKHTLQPVHAGAEINSHDISRDSNLGLTEREMRDIGSMIEMLNKEVCYYEQLTGRRSAIDVEEMKIVAGLDGCDNDWSKKQPVTVMRYLVHLVCQSMSHMLQSEVEKVSQKKDIEILSSKVEHLLSLNAYQAEIKKTYDLKHPSSPEASERVQVTPSTDQTVDLYATSSPLTVQQSVEYDRTLELNVSSFSTPLSGSLKVPSSLATKDLSKPKVRFHLNPDVEIYTNDPAVEVSDEAEVGQFARGTATSDWLFSSTSTLAALEHDQMLSQSEGGESPPSTPSSAASKQSILHMTPPEPPQTSFQDNSRVRELQRQLAMIRQKPSSDISTSSAGSRFLMQTEHITSEEASKHLSFRKPSAVRVPAVQSAQTSQSGHQVNGDIMGKYRVNKGSIDMMDTNEIDEDLSATHTSLSSVPAQLLPPTPERQPIHPFLNSQNAKIRSTERLQSDDVELEDMEFDIRSAVDKTNALLNTLQEYNPKRTVYDARNGSF